MEVSKILSADLLDIIFDGRNKTYGAYELRKTYSHRLAEALIITIAVCVVSIGVPHLFLAFVKPASHNEMFVKDVSLEDLKQQDEKKNIPPPPPPPKMEPPKVEISKFTPPLIVKDAEVKEADEIKEVSKLEDTKIGTINQEGTKDEGLVTAAPVEAKGTGTVEAPKQQEDYDKIYTIVEIPAEFPGGQPAWQKYLERNLNRDLPIQNGAPVGKYIVRVSFLVDKTGAISDVRGENDPGYGTQEEAIRVIQKGPNWKPAVQNGRNVNYRHIQNIVFVVSDSE
jgi:protein TonB